MSQILGRYELQRLLGRGGMAEVYLARRRAGGIEKRLVIKRIRRERAGDPRFLDMFVNEARLSMSLSHQNIVTVFDFGRIGDDVFLAMEHVEGRDLASTLARAAAPMPPLLAAHVASECCRGLAHAHRRIGSDGKPLHVVHRDVTPRNVLLSWAGEVKVTDFGVAALAGASDDKPRGTWAYMAPEQARAEVVDPRADLYALGLVLWEMLAGRRARRGADATALADEARSGTLPPRPDTAPALDAILARATAPSPTDRYADADEMLAALDTYLVTARAAAPGPAPGRQLADWLVHIWGDQSAEPATSDDMTALTVDDPDAATMRSMAETAGDDDDPPPVAPEPPAATLAPGAPSAVGDARRDRPHPLTVPDRPRKGRWLIVAAVMIGCAFAILAVRALRTSDTRTLTDASAAVVVSGESVIPRASGDASMDGSPGPSATGVAPPSDADTARADDGVVDAARSQIGRTMDAPASHAGTSSRVADASPRTVDAPPAALRDVTIGAVPWADFTIEGDPTVHQTPETVRLSPGKHRVTFRNPQLGVERTVTIDVPADRDLRHLERLADP